MARHRILRQFVAAIAVIVVARDVLEERACMLIERVINNQRRLIVSINRTGSFINQPDPLVIEFGARPQLAIHEAINIGVVGALDHAARYLAEVLSISDDQAGQVIGKVLIGRSCGKDSSETVSEVVNYRSMMQDWDDHICYSHIFRLALVLHLCWLSDYISRRSIASSRYFYKMSGTN